MPKPDYKYVASVVIGCPGGSEGPLLDGPIDMMRSRAHARLQNVEADCAFWSERMAREGTLATHALGDATTAQLLAAISSSVALLNMKRTEPDANGGQLDLIFSGHGLEDGSLVLKDRPVAVEEIVDAFCDALAPGPDTLKLSFVFDCCHSGHALAKIVTHAQHGQKFLAIDGFAAALHDEKAYELTSIAHGAFTYAMRYPGNGHVDHAALARAVNDNDDRALRAALQGMVPNPTTYLTRGKQHSVEVINGHHVTVHGLGSIELAAPDVTTREMLSAFEALRTRNDANEVITFDER